MTALAPFAQPGDLAGDYDPVKAAARIAAASARVRKHCGWAIWPQQAAVTLTLDGSGQNYQELPSLYVTEITSVTEDGTALVEDQDYTWSEAGLLIKTGSEEWTNKFRAVVVVLTHCYADLPEDVREIVIGMVTRSLESPYQAAQESAQGLTAVYITNGIALSAADRQALGPYTIL